MPLLSPRLKAIVMWLVLLLVSLAIHVVLTWQASLHIVSPELTATKQLEEIEIMLDIAEPEEKEELVFEEAIEFGCHIGAGSAATSG